MDDTKQRLLRTGTPYAMQIMTLIASGLEFGQYHNASAPQLITTSSRERQSCENASCRATDINPITIRNKQIVVLHDPTGSDKYPNSAECRHHQGMRVVRVCITQTNKKCCTKFILRSQGPFRNAKMYQMYHLLEPGNMLFQSRAEMGHSFRSRRGSRI